MPTSHHARGFGLIETIVGIAIFLALFLALLGLLRVSIILSIVGKASASASSVAQSQVEYLRGLAYDSLGTVGGIPAGLIPQVATTTVSGVDFVTHTFIEYVDDPADGTGALDQTGITTDYKVAKVSVSYVIAGIAKSIAFISNFVPPTIESSTGGGTLQVKVVDPAGACLSGATVHIINTSTSPPVDLTTFSNMSGIVYLPGAATSSEYQVYVSKSGCSSAQTYPVDAQNANPTPGLLTISKDQTTTGTFAIDLMGVLTLSTFSPPATTTFADTFANGSNIAASSSVIVSGGTLTLNPGEVNGNVRSIAFAPQYLSRWESVSSALSTTTDTSAAIQIYDGSGALLPDAVLPGNSVGFMTFPINLSTISTSTYPSLAIGALLSTATTTAPSILGWSISALAGPAPLANVSFMLTGTKTIGSTAGGAPIYKTVVNTTTGAGAQVAAPLERDGYALSVPGYDIVDTCPTPPYTLAAGESLAASLVLGAATTNSLFISVVDSGGLAVSGATVDLTRAGFSASVVSSACGNAYFGNISANTYTVTISKAGYTTTQFPGVAVGGLTTFEAAFP